jgi:hypothetical protein
MRRGVFTTLLCALFAAPVSRSAQLPPDNTQAPKAHVAVASSGKPVLDGLWWDTLSPAERSGYINGYEDCYVYDAKGIHTATGWTANHYVQAVEGFYREHSDQRATPVSSVLKQINRTGKPRPIPKGGEEWKERHGYYDGLWWRGSSPSEQLGYIEGYLSCYSTEVTTSARRFSKAFPEYVKLLNTYMKEHLHSDEEKVANILGRFADRQPEQ